MSEQSRTILILVVLAIIFMPPIRSRLGRALATVAVLALGAFAASCSGSGW